MLKQQLIKFKTSGIIYDYLKMHNLYYVIKKHITASRVQDPPTVYS